MTVNKEGNTVTITMDDEESAINLASWLEWQGLDQFTAWIVEAEWIRLNELGQ